MSRQLLFLLLSFLLLSACASDQPKKKAITLSLNFSSGSTYIYTLSTQQTITQKMAGMNSVMKQHMQLISSYKVDDAEDGNKKLTINHDHFYIKSSSNGMTMEYDSKDTSRQPDELASITGFVNQPFSIIVNTRGDILKVENKLLPIPDSTAENVRANDSSIRKMMEQSLSIYPAQPVRIGDTWQKSYSTNLGLMDMLVTSNYKLMSISDGIAHIEINASVKSTPSLNQSLQGMQMEMTGTQSGTMDIEIQTGLIRDSEFSQEVIGKMNIPGAEIPMHIQSDTRIIGISK